MCITGTWCRSLFGNWRNGMFAGRPNAHRWRRATGPYDGEDVGVKESAGLIGHHAEEAFLEDALAISQFGEIALHARTLQVGIDPVMFVLGVGDVDDGAESSCAGRCHGEERSLLARYSVKNIGARSKGWGAPDQDQSRTIFPESPERMVSKACAKSAAGNLWVITARVSRPARTMALILYQVSNISRP